MLYPVSLVIQLFVQNWCYFKFLCNLCICFVICPSVSCCSSHVFKLLYVWYKGMKYVGCCGQKSTEINSVSTRMLKLPRKMAYMSWKGGICVLVLMQLSVFQKPMY